MRLSRLALVLALSVLVGCGSGGDFADLRAYMDEVRARPKGAIEPLPKFQPYESFTYRAASLRTGGPGGRLEASHSRPDHLLCHVQV